MYVTMLIELPPGMSGAAKMVLAALRWLAARLGWFMADGYYKAGEGDNDNET